MRHGFARFLAVGLALGIAVSLPRAVAGEGEAVPLQMTAGTELAPEEDAAVRASLLGYLEAIRKRDWRTAARHVDRESFLAGIEPLVAAAEPVEGQQAAARRRIFGASTVDSLGRMKIEDLFASMMSYATVADSAGVHLMERARFALLGARKIEDRVHIAYQLTLPAESDSLEDYTRVTAERMRKVGHEWKIIIQHDQ